MIDLLVAKLSLYLCGSLSSFLVLVLCLEINEREYIKYYYLFLIMGLIGCIYMVLGLFILKHY